MNAASNDTHVERAARLDTATLSDALDRYGIAGQCHRIARAKVAAEAARAAVRGATPTAKNSYKVPILEAVVRRTILEAAAL